MPKRTAIARIPRFLFRPAFIAERVEPYAGGALSDTAQRHPCHLTGRSAFTPDRFIEIDCNSIFSKRLRRDFSSNPALVWNLRPKYSEERKAMKRMCAWCGLALDPSERREHLQVTHGVCKACRRRFFASPKAKEADSRSTKEEDGDGSGYAAELGPGTPTTAE
jgi:hypothetical protein